VGIGGWVAPGFELVEAEFARNFSERNETGAAFAAVLDGETVVDLWGGLADRETGRPWESDTLQVVFSGTKGFVAVCLLILIERGELDLQRPVADYWPEFGAAGKAGILVEDVVCHRARLPAISTPLTTADLVDDVAMAERLAKQHPSCDPRAAFVYHALTFGWLCGEIVRRIDGRSVGRLFAEEVAEPLELEIWIGLPSELEPRVATLRHADTWGSHPQFSDPALRNDPLLASIRDNPPVLDAEQLPFNTRGYHAAEIPGAGGIGTARSIARLYGCLARGGEIDGIRLLAEDTVALGRQELARGHDPFIHNPMAFGVGFQLQTELRHLGPPASAFGHNGAGGSTHAAWPDERVGLSYAMNELRDEQDVDPRAGSLLAALHRAVQRAGPRVRQPARSH
jgi:CubicO group peptidase (beta-lactamase class C family)